MGLIFWTYFGYFAFLVVLSRLRSKKTVKKEYRPLVSIVITAYNEENNIKNKIENCLALDYSKDMLEIIVVSDGSSDKTGDIVRSFDEGKVRLLEVPVRRGKDYCQGPGNSLSQR